MSKRRALELLPDALALEGEERAAFVNSTCGDDAALREALEALIAQSAATSDSYLSMSRPGNEAPTLPMAPLGDRRPFFLGPYRLLESLGRGGMGTVYLAEQKEPVERRVALKVLHSFKQAQQAERFALECQVLARLSHPHIASLYEVGETDDGRPYVAMELVEGEAITDGCDARGLDLVARIELFCGVCAGVRHAHEKGILHRDLKPSNVLVTDIDGQPTAKVIDFGIARPLDHPLFRGEKRLTQFHQIVGSPIYMSPEALRGDRDVDARSDVHALGLILYELLVGVLPFDSDRETLPALLQRITEGELTSASLRFADLSPEERRRIAEARGVDARTLGRRLGGDLDAILAKALAHDRENRYGSPADLAADLRRALARQPVSARPYHPTYVLGRYLQRHLGFAIALAALILSLVGGVLVSAREARRANQEARRAVAAVEQTRLEAERARRAQSEAQEVSAFLVDLFALADPEKGPDEPVDARQLFERGVQKLRTDLQDQPLARARLLDTVAEIYTKMAWFDEAEPLAVEALDLRRSHLESSHDDVLSSLNRLGVLYRLLDRMDEAEPLLTQVVRARETASPRDADALAQALNNLGNLYWSDARQDEATEAHQRALELRESLPDINPNNLAESLNNLGVMMQSLGRYEEAEVYLRRADTIFLETKGPEHPIRAACLNNLGMISHRLGRWRRAETALRDAVEIWTVAYGAHHPRPVSANINLARLFDSMGRYAESAKLWADIAKRQAGLDAPSRRSQSTSWRQLGVARIHLGEFDDAEASLNRALRLAGESDGPEHPRRLRIRSRLAWLEGRRGNHRLAERRHRELLRLQIEANGQDHVRVARERLRLATALIGQGRDLDAEPHLRLALEVRQKELGIDHRDVADVQLELGDLVARRGEKEEAQSLFAAAAQIYEQVLPTEHPAARRAASRLANS